MEAKGTYYLANREAVKARNKAYQESRPGYVIWQLAKHRAKRNGWEFSITIEDITIPETCPILGMKLEKKGMAARDNSPSIDRIDSSQGYVPGNIQIISTRANRIKAYGTPEELMKIALFANKNDLFVPADPTNAADVAAASEASRIARHVPKLNPEMPPDAFSIGNRDVRFSPPLEVPICGKTWWEESEHWECLMDAGHKELKHGMRGMVRKLDD